MPMEVHTSINISVTELKIYNLQIKKLANRYDHETVKLCINMQIIFKRTYFIYLVICPL